MTSDAGFPPSATASFRVDNVQLQDGNLTWTYVHNRRSGHATIDQVLFTVQPAQQPPSSSSPSSSSSSAATPQEHPFVICCLIEDTARAPFFSLHLLVTTNTTTVGAANRNALLPKIPLLHGGLPHHLQAGPDRNVDVILSTKSGTGRAESFWRHVVRPLLFLLLLGDAARAIATAEAAGHHEEEEPWNVLTTQDEQTVKRYAETLHRRPSSSSSSSSPRKTIVLISGDGGIADLLNGREHPTTQAPAPGPAHLLALLPLGTANALFHSLHKAVETSPGPTPLALALRTLFLGTPRELPTFKALFTPGARIVSHTPAAGSSSSSSSSSREKDEAAASSPPPRRHDTAVSVLHGAIVASYALHASIVHESDTPEYRVHGSTRFGMVAQRLLHEPHAYRASVEIKTPDGYRRLGRDTHSYVLVSMVSNLERTFTISPETRPLDGKLHLVQFGAVNQEKVMQAMAAAYDGGRHTRLKWEDGDGVRYEEVDGVRVLTQEEDARWRKFCVDGTIVEVERGGGMVVEANEGPATFRILVDGERELMGSLGNGSFVRETK